MLRRDTLPPPAASQVYELTERGRELRTVILELGRWGSGEPANDGPLGPDAAVIALMTMFRGDLEGTFELRLDGHVFSAERGGRPARRRARAGHGPRRRDRRHAGDARLRAVARRRPAAARPSPATPGASCARSSPPARRAGSARRVEEAAMAQVASQPPAEADRLPGRALALVEAVRVGTRLARSRARGGSRRARAPQSFAASSSALPWPAERWSGCTARSSTQARRPKRTDSMSSDTVQMPTTAPSWSATKTSPSASAISAPRRSAARSGSHIGGREPGGANSHS